MKALLSLSAALEAGIGLALILAPSAVTALLLGSTLDTPAALTVARVGGAALLALGVACWRARDHGRGMVGAMLLYNLAAMAVLVHAGLSLGLKGLGLWPAVGAHAVLAVWCASCISRSVMVK